VQQSNASSFLRREQPDVPWESHRQWSRTPQLRGLSLRAKATVLAIAIATIPVLAIGATAYYLANQSITGQVSQDKQDRAADLAEELSRLIADRFGDIQVMTGTPFFQDSKLRQVATPQEKQAALEHFVDAYKVYDSTALFDLNGNVIAKSKGELGRNSQGQITNNIKDRDHFQEVLKTDRPVISKPSVSKTTGKVSIFMVAPVKDSATGKTVAVVRARLPVDSIEAQIKNYGTGGNEYHVVDSDSGKFFMALEKKQVGRNAMADFPGLAEMKVLGKVDSRIITDRTDKTEQLVSYAPLKRIAGLPDINWDIVMATDSAIAFAPQRQLLVTLSVGTVAAALVVAAIAAYLADRATRPILSATTAVGKLGQGKLDTRVAVKGEDELAALGFNVNQMADRLQDLLGKQETETRQAQLFTAITASRAQNTQDLEAVFNRAVQGARQILQADRVVIYRFNSNWSGYISAEARASGWPRALGEKIDDSCIPEHLIEAYRQGRVVPTNNIFEAGFDPEHMQLLKRLNVKANLVTPILQQDQLFGLLVAHHCSAPHLWQQPEIEFLAQLATQVGLSLDRVSFLEQVEQARQQAEAISQEQRQQKELLQRRMIELLIEVDPVAQGDLTVRANVTPDEVGTIADSYNAIIGSLRQTVQQVQTAAQAVSQTAQGNETTVQSLSQEALRQAEEITAALDQVQLMADSVQRVALNAQQAELQAQQANQTVQAGDEAMNRTVVGISAIRETVAETTEKVKRLGEASQKISRVVSLIGDFAAQTNILAFNASIEAALAGEEGRGFAVVAEEVRSLAQQSATATAEIEQLVGDIQAETNEVATAMEAGTKQVVTGTQLVEETRQKLGQIATASTQISTLVEGIAQAAAAQAQTSASVSQTIQKVAAIADQTSEKSVGVADSFTQLLAVAQELQVGVAQFKVN
jgi:methyl-accepting chemotaxis protein